MEFKEKTQEMITEPEKSVPVMENVDIVVLGGSCTGVFAAVRAARLGAKVAIVEQSNAFGGTATNGFVCVWHTLCDTTFGRQIIGGLTAEIIERLKRVPNGIRYTLAKPGSVFRKQNYATYHLNTEELKIELDNLITEAGVIPFLHTTYSAPYTENGKLTAVIVDHNACRFAIKAKYFIDATAEGTLGAHMGMEVYRHEFLQPATTGARIYGWDALTDPNATLKKNRERIGCHIGWDDPFPGADPVRNWFKSNVQADCSDVKELTRAEMRGRAQVRDMMNVLRTQDENGKNIALLALSSTIGIRETRQLKCSYQVTAEDILSGKEFEDAIAYCAYPMDTHHPDRPTSYKFLDGTEEYTRDDGTTVTGRWRDETATSPTFWQLPYRALLPQNIPNLLICGRAIDLDKNAFAAARVMISLNQTGEAAGVAAYEALIGHTSVQEIDFKAMRQKMKQGGSVVFND